MENTKDDIAPVIIRLVWNGKNGKFLCEYISKVIPDKSSTEDTVSAVLLQLNCCKKLEPKHIIYSAFDDMPKELREEAESLINTIVNINIHALNNKTPVYIAPPFPKAG